jgi:NADH-quinone oxidoreductase subunit B
VGQGLLVPAAGTGTDDGTDAPPADGVVVLVVAGTVTDALLPAVVAAADATAADAVVAFGACTISGGPYWDSYVVTKGIDQVLPVAGYVPGCPPRPRALVAALAEVAGREPRLP